MYSTELSIVEPNGADASERTCKLPVFFFDSMNITTQKPKDVDGFLVCLRKKILSGCPKGCGEIDDVLCTETIEGEVCLFQTADF